MNNIKKNSDCKQHKCRFRDLIERRVLIHWLPIYNHIFHTLIPRIVWDWKVCETFQWIESLIICQADYLHIFAQRNICTWARRRDAALRSDEINREDNIFAIFDEITRRIIFRTFCAILWQVFYQIKRDEMLHQNHIYLMVTRRNYEEKKRGEVKWRKKANWFKTGGNTTVLFCP